MQFDIRLKIKVVQVWWADFGDTTIAIKIKMSRCS